MKDKWRRLAVVLLLLLGLGGFGYYESTSAGEDNGKTELKLSGNVDIREIALAFRGSDRITELLVDEGDTVKKGDVLARLDDRELTLIVEGLKSQIKAQESVVALLRNGTREEEKAQAAENLRALEAQAIYEGQVLARQEALYDAGAISRQELDRAVSSANSTAAQTAAANEAYRKAVNGARPEEIEQAEAQLEVLRQELARQEYLLREMTLISPADGVVRSRLLEVGDMASPSAPVFKISPHEKKWVRAYVQETYLAKIYEGQGATIFIDSLPGKGIEGKIGYISGTAEFTPKNVQTDDLRTSLLYEVRVYVDDTENVLRMGMPATVLVKLGANAK
ncbi:MAG: efflux RND transporter periplasmic adaptor subunit [Selenomonas sp.]|nr:efflux RND transporter periplasmic adaptor subunit [Selenomonas sp.]